MEKCTYQNLRDCKKYTIDPRYGSCIFGSLKFHVCRYKEIIQILDALRKIEDDSQESYHDVMCCGKSYKEAISD